MDQGLVSVALPVPFQAPFTYRMPGGVPVPERGVRVLVPFGGRRMIGVVTGPATEVPGQALKEVAQVLDESPLVPPPLLDLAAWMAEHYLAPPGECYRAVLPPAGVRASRAVVRLVKPVGAGEGTEDPVLRQLQDGPLRLSALEKRLGRDAQAPVARLRRAGLVEVEQDIDAPGFRERQVAVLAEAPLEPRGRAQAEVLERLRAAGGRARVAELVRDRPSLRGAVARLAEKGAVRLVEERDVRAPEGLPARDFAPVVPTPDQEAALRPAARRARRRRVPAVPPPRRDGQREDGGLLPRRRGGPRAGPRRDRPRARDRPDADARARRAVALRGDGVGAAQRALGGRAARPVVAHPGRRLEGGRRRALRGVRAGPGPRARRRRRGARRVLQAGRQPAVPRPRRRGDALAPRGLPGGARLGHSLRRVARERAAGQVREAPPPSPHRPAGPPERRDRGPPGHAQGGRRPHPRPDPARRPRRPARAPRAEPRPPEPEGLRHEPSLPRVRPGGHVPELLGVAHAAPGGALGAVPLLRPRGEGAHVVPVVPRGLPAPDRLRHRARGRGGAGGPARRAGREARPRPRQPARGRSPRRWRRSRRARSTCSSARR